MNRSEDISKESIIVRTTAAFSGKGNVLRMTFEDIQSNMANNSHTLCMVSWDGMPCSNFIPSDLRSHTSLTRQ